MLVVWYSFFDAGSVSERVESLFLFLRLVNAVLFFQWDVRLFVLYTLGLLGMFHCWLSCVRLLFVCLYVCVCVCVSVCRKMTRLLAKPEPRIAVSALLGFISKVQNYARV